MFLSLVRPDRISSPITRIAAVMTSVLAPVFCAPDVSFIGLLPQAFCCSAATAPAQADGFAKPPLLRAFPPPLPGRHRHRYNRSRAEGFNDLLLRHPGARR